MQKKEDSYIAYDYIEFTYLATILMYLLLHTIKININSINFVCA